MIVILPFVINAGMNFILGLLIAYFLGPEAFGVYAIGAAILVLVNTSLIDWLKLSAIRFYSLDIRTKEPDIRKTLDGLAAAMAILVSTVLMVLIVSGISFRMPSLLVAAAVAGGICAGLFDYHGAIARALYLDVAYARLIIIKNLLALLLMVGVAWAFRDPTLVLFGGVLSAAVALISVRHVLADAPLSFRNPRWDLVAIFARYGFPLIAANVVYSIMPLFNRSSLAATYDYAEAGYFSLASDMGIRLFGTLGATLEIVMLREVVRIEHADGVKASHQRIAANLPLVLLFLLPVAAGWWLVLPAFESIFVPVSFRGHFALYMTILTPAFLALGLFQAGLNPVFLIGRQTAMATGAAGLGLLVNLAFVWLAPQALGPYVYAYAQLAGFLVAFLFTAIFALSALMVRPDYRAMALVALATTVMVVVLLPLRGYFPASAELLLLPMLGSVVYAAIILLLDIAGCRTKLRQALEQRRKLTVTDKGQNS